jgi:hypothetical protein
VQHNVSLEQVINILTNLLTILPPLLPVATPPVAEALVMSATALAIVETDNH